jgi:hypothetical protein
LWAEYPGLKVYMPNPEFIFAMKAIAARTPSSDMDDLRALRDHLQLTSVEQAFAIVEKYVPQEHIPPKTEHFLLALFSEE